MLLTVLKVGLVGSVLSACTVEQQPASAPTSVAQESPAAPAAPPPVFRARAETLDSWPVPPDFPAMMGCSDEELAHPDALVETNSRVICEAAQLGLYQLSQEAGFSEDEAKMMAFSIMGVALERLVAARAASDSGDAGVPDGGSPGDGGMPY